jgi:ABC-type nitrate/sulfonate/bicarbonate transport system permease component
MNSNFFLKPFQGGQIKLIILAQAIMLFTIWMLAPKSLFPSPLEVLSAWNSMAKNDGLLVELGRSIITITEALFFSTIISATLAYAAAINVLKPISNGIASLRFLGFAGITFMFTMLSADGGSLKVWLLTFGMTVFLLTNMLAITNSISKEEVDYARTLRLSPMRTVYELLIRGKLHDFLDLVRQNAAIGWTMLSMVEGLVRSEGGIGSLLLNQSKYMHLSSIFALQLTILFYGIFQDYILGYIRLALCPYIKFINVKA